MGRPRSIIPTINLKPTISYFNSCAIEECKISDRPFCIFKFNPKFNRMYLKFTKRKKGIKCGSPTTQRQSQIYIKRLFTELKLDYAMGTFQLKRHKKKKCWYFDMEVKNGNV